MHGLQRANVALPASARVERLPEHSLEVVDYRISVRLDGGAKRLQGTERLTWRNPSPEPVADLWFHLYLNAFKNSQSTLYRASGGRLRGDTMPKDEWGWIDVTSMRLADGTELFAHRTFEHPDDDNASDETVMRVPLPRPVPAGGSVSLDIVVVPGLLNRLLAQSVRISPRFLVRRIAGWLNATA